MLCSWLYEVKQLFMQIFFIFFFLQWRKMLPTVVVVAVCHSSHLDHHRKAFIWWQKSCTRCSFIWSVLWLIRFSPKPEWKPCYGTWLPLNNNLLCSQGEARLAFETLWCRLISFHSDPFWRKGVKSEYNSCQQDNFPNISDW